MNAGLKTGAFWLGFVAVGYSLGICFSPEPAASSTFRAENRVADSKRNQSSVVPTESPGQKRVEIARAGDLHSLPDVLQYRSQIHRLGEIKTWADSIPTSQLPKVFRELLERTTDDRSDVMRMFMVSWAERDPQTAAQSLKEAKPGADYSMVRYQFFTTWAQFDATAARAWVEGHLEGGELAYALRSIRLQTKPKTLENLLAMEEPHLRTHYLIEYFSNPGRMGRQEALSMAEKLEDRIAQYNAVSRILRSWAEVDPFAAMAWLTSQPEETRNMQGYSVLRPLLQKDPALVLRLAEQTPVGNAQMTMLGDAAARMVTNDLPQALSAIEKFRERYPDVIPGQFYAAWLQKDEAAAASRLKEEIMRLSGKTKPDYATGFSNAIEAWAVRDPKAVSHFIPELPESTLPEIFATLAQAWVNKDPHEAAVWAQQLPDGRAKESAVQQLAGQWGRYEFDESSQWVRTLPDGPIRDHAAKGFAVEVFDNDPDAVLEVLRSVSDETRRAKILKFSWDRWSWKNRDTATKWLKDAPLSDAERKAFP